MKNYIKKIITLSAFTFLFIGQGVLATSFWNGLSNDCTTVAVGNYTTGTGIQNGQNNCWTLSSVNANPGDYVNVQIYYHNTGTTTATNTRLVLNTAGGSSTHHTFSGQIISDQSSTPIQTVTVNLPSSQTLTFDASYWYPNQTSGQNNATVSYSPTILNGGLNIGNIAPGWQSQGSVIVSFLVGSSSPQSNCSISSFTASPNPTTSGGNSVLSWSTNDCTSGYINQGVGNISSFPNGSKTVYNLNNITTYTLTAYGSGGSSDTESITVNINSLPTTGTLTPSYYSCTIPDGQSTCSIPFSWNTVNPVSGAISEITHNWTTVAGGNSGSQSFNISNGSQTYYLYHNSQLLDQETVNANCVSGTSWNGNSCVAQVVNDCSISYFNANPDSIEEGDSSTLTWNTNGNCSSASINNGVGSVSTGGGSRNVYPNYTTTYTLSVYGNNGYSSSRSVTVYVDENQNYDECRISYFRASPDSIDEGDSSRLTWDTNGDCDSASINKGVGSVNASGGTEYVYPDSTTTYKLTVYGQDGDSDYETVTVDVDENNQYNNNCYISYFRASPTSINSGNSSTLSWSASGDCRSVSISNIGSVSNYGSRTVYPTSTINYTIYAYGSNGVSVTDDVRINVNYIQQIPVYNNNTCAVTTVATNIGQNAVTLNGMITGSGSNAYFEYGETNSLGFQTVPRYVSGGVFSEVLPELAPNTVYYYRIVSNCGNGISRGSIQFFRTLSEKSETRVIVREGTTVVGTSSPIMLKIENRYESIQIGDIVDYTVTYKNIGSKKLTRPLLQVVLPSGISFVKSSRGTFSEDNYTLSVLLEDLEKNDGGVVYLQGRVDSINSINSQIVTTAVLVYTSSKGAQENAMAYVLNNPIYTGSSLAGLALFGWFFRLGLVGWLLLIIIILLLILIYRRYFSRNTNHN